MTDCLNRAVLPQKDCFRRRSIMAFATEKITCIRSFRVRTNTTALAALLRTSSDDLRRRHQFGVREQRPWQTQVRIGSQADPEFLQYVIDEMGAPDVILDDGSHSIEHQEITFRTLFPQLKGGGLYVAEDLHTAYRTAGAEGSGAKGPRLRW
jgi:hypothetical protein